MRSLEVADLEKSFGDQRVLTDLDLAVKPGTFVSVLGPSGSGKTTLLRLIAGFERADRGIIKLGDEVVDNGADQYVPSERRRLGYVPQEGGLFPHLSVQRNVGFGLPRRERNSRRIDELLEMVGLSSLGRRYPHQLSGGQQQRVALARALAIQPEIVLLDEPFSSLDASLRATVRRDVRQVLRDAGATTVLVTHDQDEALSLSDEVAVMHNGKLGQIATPRELYMHPSNLEIALGLGESNVVSAIAHGNDVETPLGRLVLENGPEAEGTRLQVLIRPEQITLARDAGNSPAHGKVIDAEYYGHDAVVRLQANWEGGKVIVVRLSDAMALPELDTDVGFAASGSVVGWPDVSV